jgi:hypothetical protein
VAYDSPGNGLSMDTPFVWGHHGTPGVKMASGPTLSPNFSGTPESRVLPLQTQIGLCPYYLFQKSVWTDRVGRERNGVVRSIFIFYENYFKVSVSHYKSMSTRDFEIIFIENKNGAHDSISLTPHSVGPYRLLGHIIRTQTYLCLKWQDPTLRGA